MLNEQQLKLIKRLQEYKKASGKSFERIGAEIGISLYTVRRWHYADQNKNGKNGISNMGLFRLEYYLNQQTQKKK